MGGMGATFNQKVDLNSHQRPEDLGLDVGVGTIKDTYAMEGQLKGS